MLKNIKTIKEMILEIKIKATINKQNTEIMIKVPFIQQINIIAQGTLKNLKMIINNKKIMNTD